MPKQHDPDAGRRAFLAAAAGAGLSLGANAAAPADAATAGATAPASAAATRSAGGAPAPSATQIQRDSGLLRVSLPAHDIGGEATLWLLAIAPSIGQVIAKGENAGQTVTYYNVVRNLVPAALWKGEAYDGRWMREAVMPKDCTQCVAVLQRDKTGPVLGVARA